MMIKVDKIIPGGQAISTMPDGKKIFFWGALPGETVEAYDVTKTKSHYTEAIAKEVGTKSPYRVSPKDETYLSTSPWQIMDYKYELKLKQSLVVEVFREHQISIPTSPIVTDNKDYFYRNKMEYSLYWDNQDSNIKLAFHQRGSHRKIPIKNSSIERPEILQRAKEIIAQLNVTGEQARKYQSLLLRSNQKGEVLGGLYENHQPHPTFPNLTDTIMGQEYSYSPNGFFQINLPIYEMALNEIKRHISTDEVLDLYAGVGTIGLSVARNHRLTLIEVDKYAYGELEKNCRQALKPQPTNNETKQSPAWTNSNTPIAVLTKSEEALDYIKSNQTVILDPPRSGCDKKLIERLLETHPTKIIYLSCNPSTQARDIKMLLDKYCIDTITSYNFFPRTPHIENLIILSANNK